MDRMLLTLFATGLAVELVADPSISNVRVTQDPATRTVSVRYDLSGGSAVVTLDSVSTNDVDMAESDLYNISGDANRLVATGNDRLLRWQPPQSAGFGPFAAGSMGVTLKAWATNAPPDWMVIDLSVTNRVRYYATSNAIPGGISDVRYKTSYLVMRRIPAAGVVWRMGSPSTEDGSSEYRSREHTHYVKLTEDYYIGVYPVTYRQLYYWKGSADDKFTPVGGSDDDWPVSGVQYCSLRSWFHDNNKSCDGNCGVNIKCWPGDGREIDGVNAPKCSKAGGTYTPWLRTMRDKYGLCFDLPTDAQWEFACRGGSAEYHARYGELSDIAWYLFNSSNTTYNCCVPHPVGLKRPNGYGLCDMLGGIGEVCVDFYADSANTSDVVTDPKGATPTVNDRNGKHVIRGGSFDSSVKHCRSAHRKDIGSTHTESGGFSSDQKGLVYKYSNGMRLWLPAHAVK